LLLISPRDKEGFIEAVLAVAPSVDVSGAKGLRTSVR
jgi:hypothetical protein